MECVVRTVVGLPVARGNVPGGIDICEFYCELNLLHQTFRRRILIHDTLDILERLVVGLFTIFGLLLTTHRCSSQKIDGQCGRQIYIKSYSRVICNTLDLRCLSMYSINMTTVSQQIGCVKAATEIVGDKWTPQLLRFFVNEEIVRFCQLQDLVGGINPRTLSARLLSLEQTGIIKKITTEASTRCEYSLTQKGKDLLPILHDMETWSKKYAPNCD